MKSSVNIFGTRYRIKYVDNISSSEDGPFCYGETDRLNKTITIATKDREGKSLSPEEIEVTFYHELMHVIFGEGQYLSCNDDEPLVEWCAKCLRSFKKQGIL